MRSRTAYLLANMFLPATLAGVINNRQAGYQVPCGDYPIMPGETCCDTPSGKKNICGYGTTCCFEGCCNFGHVCRADGACVPASVGGPPSDPTTIEGGGPPTSTDNGGHPPGTTDEDAESPTTVDGGNPLPTTEEEGNPVPTTDKEGNPIPTTDQGENAPLTTDENGNPIPTTNNDGGPSPTTDQGGNPIPTTNENGEPIPTTDGEGNPVPTTDQGGNPPPNTTNEEGNPVPTTDENGNTISTTDQSGNPPPNATDKGNPVPTTDQGENHPPNTTDEGGNPIPTTTEGTAPPTTTDEDKNPIPTTDENENPIPTTAEGNSPPSTTDEEGNPIPTTTEGNTPPTTTDKQNNPAPTTDANGNPITTTDEGADTSPTTTDEDGNPPPSTDEEGNPTPTTEEQGNDPTVTDGPLVNHTEWPSVTIIPVETEVPEPDEDDDDPVVPCTAWFFFICIRWDGGPIIGGWRWTLPPGIYVSGPPNGIKWPEGVSIEGTLPPWPKITIGNDHKPTYEDEPTSCETKLATIHVTTTSYGVSISGTATSTTTSRVLETSDVIFGCEVEDDEATETQTGITSTSGEADVFTPVGEWVGALPTNDLLTTGPEAESMFSEIESIISSTTEPTTIPIETSEGSSCVSTVTISVCQVPGQPCAPSLSCESWAATTTSTPTTSGTPTEPSDPPKPSYSWSATFYKNKCDEDITDYYSVGGYGEQSLDAACVRLKDPDVPERDDYKEYCRFFTDGGNEYGPCSEATFDEVQSWVIRGGFCTIYDTDDCSGDRISGGISEDSDPGCTDKLPSRVVPKNWKAISCFAYPRDD
ncbi:glycoside hydrolase family 18 [Fusarium albosuccineum]|uniref:Glycoside hydrolase family 18 n=1 Tax=Fusarium albosuccineum TaxID=1237068 RepID=A0A8H4LGY4_9HYPO|nr:glycoside hydrolase family 18 [Fusarium albosuccineum]